mmetsp:Transcript_19673/g.61900  ORF Transcript_19673/g.61900 Transcript_19673/m.61900 type:complete len:422 (+) Transcript_19673:48-1313(+)
MTQRRWLLRTTTTLGLVRTFGLVAVPRTWRGESSVVTRRAASKTFVEEAREWGGAQAEAIREVAMVMQCAVRLCLDIEESMAVARGETTFGTEVEETVATAGSALVKGDQTPVTAADFAIQGFVSWALQRRFPDDLLMGEEDSSGLVEDEALLRTAHEMARRMARELDGSELGLEEFVAGVDRGLEAQGDEAARIWILDPIDGTKGLVTGQQYVVGLALVERGEPVLAFMGNPGAKVLSIMVACKGHGIRYWPYAGFGYMRDATEAHWQGVKFDYSKLAADASGSWGEVGSAAKAEGVDYPPYLISRPATAGSPMPFGPAAPPSSLCCGALVKYWATAAGTVAGFIQYEASLKAWDHAAGVLCVLESGGVCLDASDNPVRFTGRTFRVDRAIICAARAADPKARHLLKQSVLDAAPVASSS